MVNFKLAYVGDKPTISPNGIYFNHSKPDKYIYLQAISHVVHTLLDLKDKDDVVEYFNLNQKFNDAQILELLYRVVPEFDDIFQTHIDEYVAHLKSEEEEVSHSALSDTEKEILENNYHLMFDYRIQRATNKLVYENLVNGAVKIILDKKVAKIKAIFTREFFHVFQSLKGVILSRPNYPETSIQFIEEDGKEMEVELNIKFLKPIES